MLSAIVIVPVFEIAPPDVPAVLSSIWIAPSDIVPSFWIRPPDEPGIAPVPLPSNSRPVIVTVDDEPACSIGLPNERTFIAPTPGPSIRSSPVTWSGP